MTPLPDGSRASGFEEQLGRQLAALVAREGADAFASGVANRRIQAGVQDLMGVDTTLATPLRDLVQRPGFRLLFSEERRSQTIGARDALLADLAQVYSPTVVQRLNLVLDGCLGQPATSWQPAWDERPPATPPAPSAPSQPQATPHQAPAPAQVITVHSHSGLLGGLVALIALLAGALVLGLAWVLMQERPLPPGTQADNTPTQARPRSDRDAAVPSNEVAAAQEAEPEPSRTAANNSATSDTWAACIEEDPTAGVPPQPGEVWWPVVGPKDSLAAARVHCRPDAYVNQSGNVQIASFRDRESATAFAEQLTRDNSHPFHFWVGDATQR